MAFSNQFLDSISVEAGKPTKASELNNVSENTDAIKERMLEGHYFNNNGVDGEDGYHRADYTDPLWFLSKSTGNTTHKYTALWLDNSDASDVKIRISVQGSTAAIPSMTSGQEIGGGAIISNIGANRVITSDGGIGTLNAESNLLFNGSSLTVFTDALVADSNKRVIVGSSSTNAGNKFEVRFDSNQISKFTNPSSGYAELQIETNNTSQRLIQFGIEGTSAGNRMTGTRANAGYIGTYSNDNFTFHTNNQRRAEITASGDFVVENYLGINSASPTNPIYIEGSGGTNASIKILETGSGNSRSLRLQQNSGASIIASEGSSNSLILQTSSEVFRLTQNLELLFGITSARTGIRIDPSTSTPNVTPNIQIESTSTYKPSITLINNENSSISNRFYLGKTRSGSVGGNTAVTTGDELGNIIFIGADGSRLSNAGIISAVVPTTGYARTPVVGSSNVPMNLVVYLTRDQYLIPTKRIEIDHDGHTDFFDYSGTTVRVRIDGLAGGILIDKTTRSTSLGNTYDVDANNYINADLGYVVNDTNYVWHQGNDGTGSGLDADLLDGQQGSYYQAASSAVSVTNPGANNIALATNSTTITGQSNLTWSGSLLSVGGAVNANNLVLDASGNYPILLENQAGTTADAAISTFDDANGTLLALGSNFYISSGGAETRFNTSEEAAGIVLNRTGIISLRTSDGSNNTVERVSVGNTGDVTVGSGNLSLSAGFVTVAGNPSAGVIGSNGNGQIGGLTGNGLFLYGKGSTYDLVLANATTNVALAIPTGTHNVLFSPNVGGGSSATLTVKTGSINSDSIRLEAAGTTSTWLESRGYLGHSWYVDTTRKATLDANGLGVGVDSPQGTVHARTGTDKNIRLQTLGSNAGIGALNDASSSYVPLNLEANDLIVNQYSGGNMGLGVTPSTWRSTETALQIDRRAALYADSHVTTALANNLIINSGGYALIEADAASQYYQYQGAHVWQTVGSGSAGANVSLSTEMTLNSTGLGLGAASPVCRLDLIGTGGGSPTGAVPAGGVFVRVTDTATVGEGAVLRLQATNGVKETAATISAVHSTSNNGDLTFGMYEGGATHNEKMRLTSAGNVGIGTVTPSKALSVVGDAVFDGPTQTISSAGAGRVGAAISLDSNYQFEAGYSADSTISGSDYLGAVYFNTADTSGHGVGVGAAIRSMVIDPYGRYSLDFHTTGTDATEGDDALRMRITNQGDIQFIGSAGNLYWEKSTSNLGIGTNAPSSNAAIHAVTTGYSGASGAIILEDTRTDANPFFQIKNDARQYNLQVVGARSDNFEIYDNGAGAIRLAVTSGGNVGIGSQSPTYKLVVSNGGAAGYEFNVNGLNSGVNTVVYNRLTSAYVDSAHFVNNYYIYSGQTPAERFRVESTGVCAFMTPNVNIRFNGTATSTVLTNNNGVEIHTGGYIWAARQAGSLYLSRAGSTGEIAAFRYDAVTQVGSISVTSTNTAYNTSSDYRLKENLVPITGAIDRVNALQPRRFNFISDPDTTVDGFVAHEVSSVVPEAITGEKDEVDKDGNPVYQGIDQSKLVPLLVASIKELVQKVNDLEQRLDV